jgi:hypothetical protein
MNVRLVGAHERIEDLSSDCVYLVRPPLVASSWSVGVLRDSAGIIREVQWNGVYLASGITVSGKIVFSPGPAAGVVVLPLDADQPLLSWAEAVVVSEVISGLSKMFHRVFPCPYAVQLLACVIEHFEEGCVILEHVNVSELRAIISPMS